MAHYLFSARHIFFAIVLFLGSSIALTSLEPLQASPTPTVTEDNRADRSNRKPRIAILAPDFNKLKNASAALTTWPKLPEAIWKMTTEAFINEGTHGIVDRNLLVTTIGKQDIDPSEQQDANTAAEIGRILGVDAALLLSINRFDVVQETKHVGLFSRGTTRYIAHVKLTGKLIDVDTGDPLATAEGVGEATRKDYGPISPGIVSQPDKAYLSQLLSSATQDAIDHLVPQIAQITLETGDVPAAPQARVAYASNTIVVLDRGTNLGFQKGEIVDVIRISKEIKDPQAGKATSRATSTVGRLKLTDVRNSFSYGRQISGSPPQVGDVVRPVE